MKNEEFLGIIKLVTGEQIVSKILPYPDEQGFLLESPLEIDTDVIETPYGMACKVDLSPWFKFSKDSIFFIDKEKVMSIGEPEDKLSQLYYVTVRKMVNQTDSNQVSLDKEMGFKNKIEEARSVLEDIFKLNIESKDNS
jgi:hypothetical protein